jgi:mannose-6-phosphate isomerase-like protein (cupin superfamily)
MDDSPDTRTLENAPEVTAPDGSTVRPLCQITGLGSFAHFQLEAGETSTAVSHRTVQEIWYVVGGAGCIWRQQEGDEPTTVELASGVCLTIPVGTTFLFRASDDTGEPLRVVAVTIPPWPLDSDDEARPQRGPWTPTVPHA